MKYKNNQLSNMNQLWYLSPEFLKITQRHYSERKYHEIEPLEKRFEILMIHKKDGNKMYKQKQYKEALKQYSLALSPFVYFHSHEGKNDPKNDEITLKDETNKLPHNKIKNEIRQELGNIFSNSGLCLNNNEKHQHAIFCFRRSLIYDNNNPKTLFNLSDCLINYKGSTTTDCT
eukprot:UN06041